MGVKREFVYALGFCAKKGKMTVSTLQRLMNWSEMKARAALDWMEKNYYIAQNTSWGYIKVLISLNQYKLSFADYLDSDRLFQRKYEKELLTLLEKQ